ncbi:hypothetical protein [Sphingomonas nostoxanthinifaciens]|uniref:hypothetical protein n=1 Tax=Sphingomonas nostoxanthinifaciens TaxID=2872652 RepID=UPI001CC1D50A|nr:hypothetical protein [Sphingomonas nostoxanthinifaciens]UAK24116.1 hypothetical protein K8P63_17570 [Sphingomonas nostoxanthinifaciens]
MIWALLIQAANVDAAVEPPASPITTQRQQVVEAIRNCPKGAPGEIVVCSKDRGVAEGFRLPKLDPRFAGSGVRPSGRGTLDGAAVGATGVGACNAVGASGATGCSLKQEKAWGEWKKQQKADGKWFPW